MDKTGKKKHVWKQSETKNCATKSHLIKKKGFTTDDTFKSINCTKSSILLTVQDIK